MFGLQICGAHRDGAALPFKDLLKGRLAVAKNVPKLLFDINAVCQSPEWAEGQGVVDAVNEANTALNFDDLVIVEPQFVGPDTLLVDEAMLLANVLNLGQPALFAEEGNAYAVFDDQPIGHLVWEVGNNLEVEFGRCDAVQVLGPANEIPSFGEGCRDYLFVIELVHSRHLYGTFDLGRTYAYTLKRKRVQP